jgi:ketosteroid isomerase-like protein
MLLSCGSISAQKNVTEELGMNSFRQTLLIVDRDWATAAKANDMETIWSYWTEDAMLLISPQITIKGKDQIKNFTTQSRKDPNFQISWETRGAKVYPSADMGYTYGVATRTITGDSGQLITESKSYLRVWERTSKGTWKCVIGN